MMFGVCPLSIVPIRLEPSDVSEMVTQALYGDTFKIIEQRKKWSKIRFHFDHYEGWIDNKQLLEITEEDYNLINSKPETMVADLVAMTSKEKGNLMPICLGSNTNATTFLNEKFEGTTITPQKDKKNIIESALLYLNAPYLWGGKTPFGIDCSGFTQMVYKLNGFKLKRDACQQATQGEALSFIEESEPGDLAFFDNAEGAIVHVGIIMANHYIIHAHGKVRIDRIDHTGIFNLEKGLHTHKLRVIKRIV